MRRRSGLDRLLFRFQDRWETDHQFRAMVSGVLGLVMIVALCSCMGVVTTVANNAFANVSASRSAGTSSNTPNADTGIGQIKAQPTFPTATVAPWPQSGPPTYSIIPNSQTPVPSPTDLPTATPLPSPTPCVTNCGGGGGGGGTFSATVTGSPSPATWVAGSAASFTVHSSPGGVGLAIIISFPGGGTYLDENGEMTDAGTGNYTSRFTVPGGTSAGTADVYVQAYYNGIKKDFHFGVVCAP
ncbi:MAG TPA: hypothetical protein VFU63_11315 [Ktedonobacterales bacterium]|nr:hypothetical protein [Ktedonobacterales bacterium]